MNRKLFLPVIKELNQDEELLAKIDEKKITVVGVKTDILIQDFKRVMIKLDDAGLTDDVPENCIDFFEENLDEFMPKKDAEKIEEEVIVEETKEELEQEPAEEREESKEGSEEVKEELGKEPVDDEVEEKVEKKSEKDTRKSKYHEECTFLAELVKAGKYTSKEIIEKAVEKFPKAQKKLFSDKLSYGKNPKYNRFDSLVLMGDDGVLYFK